MPAQDVRVVRELISDLFRFGSRQGRDHVGQNRNNLKGQVRTGGPYWI
jgi:hypothetical protein